MSDHHVDSMNINYSAVAKEILLRTGMFIPGAPEINHKPGNDFLSDVLYPLPNYPDTRFAVVDNNTIKTETILGDRKNYNAVYNIPSDEEILDKELSLAGSVLTNPIIEYLPTNSLLTHTVFPYTGLAVKAVQKKAFDISYVKNQKLETKEVVTGHLYSIATFDGRAFHIFRGKCINIISENVVNEIPKTYHRPSISSNTLSGMPLYRNIDDPKNTLRQNIRFVLDVSKPMESKQEFIPLNQIIDIEEYNYNYNFSIYIQDIDTGHDNWWELLVKNDELDTMVPSGPEKPDVIQYPTYEHQPINPDIAPLVLDTFNKVEKPIVIEDPPQPECIKQINQHI